MSKSFDAYYRKALRHDWNLPAQRRAEIRANHLHETNENIIMAYNEIWQPAMDFVQNKLSALENDTSESDRWFLEAMQGVLLDNKLEAEDAATMDNKTLRQKLDGFTSKLDAMIQDAPSGEVSDYFNTFCRGVKSFRNRIDISQDALLTQPAPEAAPETAPEAAAPAPEEPPVDQNSTQTLLRDLTFPTAQA